MSDNISGLSEGLSFNSFTIPIFLIMLLAMVIPALQMVADRSVEVDAMMRRFQKPIAVACLIIIFGCVAWLLIGGIATLLNKIPEIASNYELNSWVGLFVIIAVIVFLYWIINKFQDKPIYLPPRQQDLNTKLLNMLIQINLEILDNIKLLASPTNIEQKHNSQESKLNNQRGDNNESSRKET